MLQEHTKSHQKQMNKSKDIKDKVEKYDRS